MTKEEIKHINWMYNRLTSVHKENPNVDYMISFKEIIDKQLTLCDVVSCVCKIPEPRLKVSENGTFAYCNKCSKTYWQK